MTRFRVSVGMTIGCALFAGTTVHVQAQSVPGPGPAQLGDSELSCPALSVEMGKAAQLMAQAQTAAQAVASPAATGAPPSGSSSGALAALTAAAGGSGQLEQIGGAYQQQQNAQQLANLQVMAARGGVNPGVAGAAIGGLAAMQQIAANGGNARDAAASMATDKVSGELAKRIPGGAMLGGLMGGFMKKKKKPVEVAAVAAAPVAAVAGGAQARLTFLSALVTAKGCK